MKFIKIFLMILMIFFYHLNTSFADSYQKLHKNFSQKIILTSANFLNAPYLKEPLGEGAQGEFNQEPLYRFDRFDCETFVDTVLAMALSTSKSDFKNQMLNIRYQHFSPNFKPDFYHRNHFPDADWITNILKHKLFRFLPDMPSEISLTLHKKDWYQHLPLSRIKITGLSQSEKIIKLKQLHQYADIAENNQIMTLPYMPVNLIKNRLSDIPSGSIIFIIKPTITLISHMGFGIWKNKTLYLRAASSQYEKVIDLPLLSYLDYHSKTGIKGITVLMPKENF